MKYTFFVHMPPQKGKARRQVIYEDELQENSVNDLKDFIAEMHDVSTDSVYTESEELEAIIIEMIDMNLNITRKEVVPMYRKLIMADPNAKTEKVNSVIINRWSRAGLIYIKELAWKILSNKYKR